MTASNSTWKEHLMIFFPLYFKVPAKIKVNCDEDDIKELQKPAFMSNPTAEQCRNSDEITSKLSSLKKGDPDNTTTGLFEKKWFVRARRRLN